MADLLVCLPIIICVGSSTYYFLLLQVTPGIFRTWQPSARETGPKNFPFPWEVPLFSCIYWSAQLTGTNISCQLFYEWNIFQTSPNSGCDDNWPRMTPAGTVVVVDGGKLPGERSKRRRVPGSIVRVYYVHIMYMRKSALYMYITCTHIMYVCRRALYMYITCTPSPCVLRARTSRTCARAADREGAPDLYADSAGPARCEGAHLYADQ